jgi:hypothetical protein
VSDADEYGAVAKSDDRGAIRGCVIDDYQFVRFAYSPACRVQAFKRGPEQALLVIGRDDERDHWRFGMIRA